MKYYTADYHLGETDLSRLFRPFRTAGEMFTTLLSNHNKIVSDNDTVYMVGDIISQRSDSYHYWLSQMPKFKGKKILVCGNHEPKNKNLLSEYFDQVVDGIDDQIGQIKLFVNHFPHFGVPEKFNLVGHVHGSWRVQLNMLNVGVDVHHFRPISEIEVAKHINTIVTYTDDDTWAYKFKANKAFESKRGVRGITA